MPALRAHALSNTPVQILIGPAFLNGLSFFNPGTAACVLQAFDTTNIDDISTSDNATAAAVLGANAIANGPTVVTGGITACTVNAGGAGYAGPTVPITINPVGGGTGAVAHGVVTAGVVTSIVIDSPGTGYDTPTFSFPPSPQVGQILSVTVTDGGTGYSNTVGATTAVVLDPTGNGAVLSVTVAAGIITAITVVSPGSGYTSPTIEILNLQPVVEEYNLPAGVISTPYLSGAAQFKNGIVVCAVQVADYSSAPQAACGATLLV